MVENARDGAGSLTKVARGTRCISVARGIVARYALALSVGPGVGAGIGIGCGARGCEIAPVLLARSGTAAFSRCQELMTLARINATSPNAISHLSTPLRARGS